MTKTRFRCALSSCVENGNEEYERIYVLSETRGEISKGEKGTLDIRQIWVSGWIKHYTPASYELSEEYHRVLKHILHANETNSTPYELCRLLETYT